MNGRLPAKIGARSKLWVNIAGIGIWSSGVAWLVFHYFMVRQGQFGPERSPLEPWWLKLHGAFAFLALWLAGLLWGVHIVNGWRLNRRRWSGSVLLAGFAALILTGYLLYYTGDDQPRAVVSVIHWVIGLASPILYGAHRLISQARRKRARPADPVGLTPVEARGRAAAKRI